MSEYVVYESESDEVTDYLGVKHRVNHIEKREEIVRCRDCKYVSRDEKIYRECYRLHGYNSFTVEEYGFCAWGERRDA